MIRKLILRSIFSVKESPGGATPITKVPVARELLKCEIDAQRKISGILVVSGHLVRT